MPVDRQREVAFIRFLLFGSLLGSIGLGGVAVYKGALPAELLAALVVVTAAVWFLVAFLDGRGRPVAWLITVGALNAILVVPELALRVGGFHYESGIELEFTEQKAFQKFVRDPELFWKADPARPEVNSWGFVGPEVAVPKPDGVFRVLYLGDSCAQWGRPHPYPDVVQRRLNAVPTGAADRRVESVSLSIAGYTSHQGRVVAERYGTRVAPDVVVVHYGWNDHWLAYGSPDAEKETSAVAEMLDRCYRSSRLLQSVRFAAHKMGLSEPPSDRPPADLRQLLGSELLDVPRVSPERYRHNLLHLARVFEAIGAPLIYVTAPSSHRALGTPRHFVDFGYAADLDSVIDLHTQYAEIVREVAHQSGQRLLDLEREMGALTPDQLKELFMSDGIHFATPGVEFVAGRIADYLEREFRP